jgi:hypothetical protein
MSKNKTLFFLFFFLFSLLLSYAQEKKSTISLKNILDEISIQHTVKFSYLEDEIVLFSIIPPQKNLTLKQKIDYLKKETNLYFNKITEQYYTISNDQNLDKPLCGFLKNSETGEGIENALIQINNFAISTFSNKDGYFELPKVSINSINIEHQGFQTIQINPKDLDVSDCITIQLNAIINELNEVKTVQYLTKGIRKLNSGAIEIKPKKFGLLPGLIEPDVLQTMQQIPGIISLDETISNINVRGGTHDQNLFLWNGIRMFQTGHFFGLISAFNPSLSHTISITKNGSSAFFGESVSSLILISSHDENEKNTSASISSNFISAEFYKKINISKSATFTISGRRSLTDFFDSPTYNNYSKRIFQNSVITDLNTNEIVDYKSDVSFYFYDFSVQYHQKISEKSELNIDFITIDNELNFNESNNVTSKNSKLSQSNLGVSAQLKHNWNTKNTTDIITYFSGYDLNSIHQAIENNQILKQRNKVDEFGLKIQHTYQATKKTSINFGYQLDEVGVTNFDEINLPFFSRNRKNVLVSHIGIIESDFKSNDEKTAFKAGIRGNYFSDFNKFIAEPRIQFNQKIFQNVNLEILGEQKSQTLSQIIDLQQDFLGIEKRRWTLSDNETVPIIRSNQISLELIYKKRYWLITLNNFYKKINGITTSSQGFQNQFELIKSDGNYQVFGTEFLVQKSFKKLNTWISYSFNNNKYEFKSLLGSSFPNNFDVTHAITWAGIYDWNSIKIALGAKWHTGRPITTPKEFTVSDFTQNINYNFPNNTKLEDYFQMNFSASKDWKLHKNTSIQIAFSLLNILNTKNSINRFYRINNSTNSVESVDTYSLNRTPNLAIKLSF